MSEVGVRADVARRWLGLPLIATSANMLEKGAGAVYSSERMEDAGKEFRRRFFTRAEKGSEDGKVQESIRRMVSFKHLNLLNPWPLKQAYDAIFCRNVVIYFGPETKSSLVQRLFNQLNVGGFLYLGRNCRDQRIGHRPRCGHPK